MHHDQLHLAFKDLMKDRSIEKGKKIRYKHAPYVARRDEEGGSEVK